MNNIKKVAAVSLFISLFSLIVGCNTVHGFGKDVSKTGHTIQKAVR